MSTFYCACGYVSVCVLVHVQWEWEAICNEWEATHAMQWEAKYSKKWSVLDARLANV